MGKKLKTLTGCVRKKSRVFLVIEAVVFELKNIKASKDIDPETGLKLFPDPFGGRKVRVGTEVDNDFIGKLRIADHACRRPP